VRAGLFSLELLPNQDEREERLIARCRALAEEPALVDEEWMKSMVVSVLDCVARKYPLSEQQMEYDGLQQRIAWYSCNEDDPILLFLRARAFGASGKHTQQLRYLRQILNLYPHFVHAKKAMIDACSAIAQGGSETAEKVYARDMAQELLDRYPYLLTEQEKKRYRSIIASLGSCQSE